VLAHSLRDARTTKRLAVLVTLDTVSAEVVAQLKAGYPRRGFSRDPSKTDPASGRL